MKLTCPYRPRTITHLACGACSAATRASCDGMAVSASGASTNAVSSAAATSATAVIGENSGCSDSLLTSSTALAVRVPGDQVAGAPVGGAAQQVAAQAAGLVQRHRHVGDADVAVLGGNQVHRRPDHGPRAGTGPGEEASNVSARRDRRSVSRPSASAGATFARLTSGPNAATNQACWPSRGRLENDQARVHLGRQRGDDVLAHRARGMVEADGAARPALGQHPRRAGFQIIR